MSFFELTLLAGLGLGGVVASQFYCLWGSGSSFAVGVIYLLCSALILPVRTEGEESRSYRRSRVQLWPRCEGQAPHLGLQRVRGRRRSRRRAVLPSLVILILWRSAMIAGPTSPSGA